MPDALRLALTRSAADPEVRNRLADVLLEMEYVDEAIRQYEVLSLHGQEETSVATRLMQAYLLKGDDSKAQDVAMRSAFQGANVLGRLIAFADVARQKAAFGVALVLYRTALDLDPTNKPLAFNVAELELVAGDPAKAWKLFSDYAGEGPGNDAAVVEVVQNMIRYDHVGMAEQFVRAHPSAEAKLAVGLAMLKASCQGLGEVLRCSAGRPSQVRGSEGLRAQDDVARHGEQPAVEGLGGQVQGPEGLRAQDDVAGHGEQLAVEALGGTDGARLARSLLLAYAQRPEALSPAVLKAAVGAACRGPVGPSACRFFAALVSAQETGNTEQLRKRETYLEGSDRKWHFTMAAVRVLLTLGAPDEAEALLTAGMAGYRKEQVLSEALKTLTQLCSESAVPADRLEKLRPFAVRLAEQVRSGNPLDFWLATQAAEARATTGDPDAALKEYERSLEQTPWEAGLRNNLAYLLSKLNRDTDRGLSLVNEALAREPANSVFYLDTLGWLQYRNGDLASAEENVRAALRRANIAWGESLAESMWHLAEILLSRGNKKDAESWYRIASFMDPFGEYGNLARAKLRDQGLDPYRLGWSPAAGAGR